MNGRIKVDLQYTQYSKEKHIIGFKLHWVDEGQSFTKSFKDRKEAEAYAEQNGITLRYS